MMAETLSFSRDMQTEETLSFFLSPPGQIVRQWESCLFDGMVEHVLGDRALQIGLPLLDTLRANGMREHWLLLEDAASEREESLREDWHRILALPETLPFANETFDLVVLPHSLDFSSAPQQLLAEAVRVLAPEGRLVLAGFNPLGPWWWRQQFVRFGCRPYLPLHTTPIGVPRLKDWFALLGLTTQEGHFGIYRPARQRLTTLNRWQWLDKAGDRWFPQCGNLYLLSAVKKIPGRIPPVTASFADTLSALAGKAGQKTVPRPMSSKIDTQP